MLKANQLLPVARDALLQGGWSEDRRIDPTATVALYRSHGFDIPGSLLELFSNLSGVQASSMGRWVDFSPELVVSQTPREDLPLLKSATGESLCPFGCASLAYLFLSGSRELFFVDRDWILFHVFQDVAALCNCVLAGDSDGIRFSRELSLDERPIDLR